MPRKRSKGKKRGRKKPQQVETDDENIRRFDQRQRFDERIGEFSGRQVSHLVDYCDVRPWWFMAISSHGPRPLLASMCWTELDRVGANLRLAALSC